MKKKFGKFISIISIIIGYCACISWATIELARYYGWQSFFNNSLFMYVYNLYLGFTSNGIAWFFSYFTAFALIVSLTIFSYKCIKESRLAYYKKHRAEVKVEIDASFYDKTYDEFTPVSAYKEANAKLDLESKYDYLINKQ